MKLFLRTLLCWAVTLSSLDALPQMTLQDCMIYAREHAHANISARLKVDQSSADIKLQVSGLMPKINSNIGGSMSFGRNIDPETNTYDTRKTLSTSLGVGLAIPLFDGLVSVNSLKAAKTARLMQVQSAQIEQDRISIEVIKAFCNVGYCKAMVQQMQSQLSRDSLALTFTDRAFRLGTKSRADLAEIEAVVANSEYELINRQNLLRKAYLTLKATMGMEPDGEPVDIVYSDWQDRMPAMAENPKVTYARLAVKEGRYTLKAAKGQWLPTLSFSAGLNTSFYRLVDRSLQSPGFGRQLKDNLGEYLSLSLSIPIFDGLASASRVKKASVQVKLLQNELDRTIYETEKELKEAQLSLAGSIQEATAAQKRYEAEAVANNAITRKYELGAASPTDLYTSGAKLAAARAALEGKKIQSFIDKILLEYYNGTPLIRTSNQ